MVMSVDYKQYEYQFEIESILQQFLAVVDNAVVMRYDKNHETGERTLVNMIKPQYVFGMKSRILTALVNKSKNYVLPVICLSVKSIKADKERLTDKMNLVSRYYDGQLEGYEKPTPITITVQMTIVTKHVTDLWQLLGKFMTSFRPYRMYSWLVPSYDKFSREELRNKIEWDMNTSIDMKEKLTETDEDKHTATLQFSVQGWLFPENKSCVDGIILDIGSSVVAESDLEIRTFDEGGFIETKSYVPLVDQYINEYQKPYRNPREYANAHPRILKAHVVKIHGQNPYYFRLNKSNRDKLGTQGNIRINGYNMLDAKVLLVPKGEEYTGSLEKVKLDYKQSELFREKDTLNVKDAMVAGYDVPVVSQDINNITVDLASIDYDDYFDLVVYDTVDYDSIELVHKFHLHK